MTPTDPLELYETMVRIRELETRIESLHYSGRMHGSFHSSMGQEGAAAGVIGCLRPTDLVTSTHRGHGHAIAKGMSPAVIIAELLGLEQGSSGGKGGSMHLHDVACGFMGEKRDRRRRGSLGRRRGLGLKATGQGPRRGQLRRRRRRSSRTAG